MQTEHIATAQPSELACLPQELQSHNDAQVLLLLQDYVDKLSHTQRTLEATYASLQQTELLAGVIHEQDCRAIRAACCCLNSLRIRVEARANVTQVARPEPRLNTSRMELVPVKRIERSHACTNAVALVISQLDRIEYNWLQRTLCWLIACALLQNVRWLLPSSPCIPSELGAPDDKMLGKELLSGLWVRPECRSYCRHSHIDHVSPPVSPFISFSPLSLRHGVVVVCFEVIKGESSCHSPYAMWSRGSWLGGSLVSAWVLCCFSHLCVWPGVCLFSACSFVCFLVVLVILGCDDTKLPSPAWIHQWTGCQSFLCVGFWLVLFLLFGFVFCLVLFCVSLLFAWFMMMTAQWTMYRSFFCGPQQWWHGTLICNYCSCNVIQCGKRPGESHEGVGRKKSKKKKKRWWRIWACNKCMSKGGAERSLCNSA